MARPIGSITTPTYRQHRASGQAVVTIDGRDFYLGPWKSSGSRQEYDRLIGEWMANGRRLSAGNPEELTVAELINDYHKYAVRYYDGNSGRGELGSIRLVLRILKRTYGPTLVKDFGPRALKAVRETMIQEGWCRKYVNAQTRRVLRVFRWGVAEEMVSASVREALGSVEGLRRGKTTAHESPKVKPVADARVTEILPFVSLQVKAMIELQQLTGMRPGEVCIMRGCDLDTTGNLWVYKPSSHKTEHHDHERTIYLGPRAREVLRPFLKTDVTAYLFSPLDAENKRHKDQRAQRKTDVQPSQVKRAEKSKRRKRKRAPRDRYDVDVYRRAITRACEFAFGMPAECRRCLADNPVKTDTPEVAAEKSARRAATAAKRSQWHRENGWHPHQLRHNAATSLRKNYGLEAAQVILGHQTLAVTEIYAEKNVAAAQKIMSEVG